MNLCLLARETGPSTRVGLARAMCDLAVSLAEEGHQVTLLTDSQDLSPTALPGVSISVVGPSQVPRAWIGATPETARHSLMHAAAAYREVRRIHEHQRPVDAVLAPLWRSEAAVCMLDGEFPTIVTCMTSLRTCSEIDPAFTELEDLDSRMALERASIGRSEYLHGLTDAVLRKTVEDFGLRPRVAKVIGRGVRDRGWVAPPEADGGRTPHVLFVGRIEHRKGVDVLLAAAEELIEGGTPARFTLVGRPIDAPLRRAFAERAADRPELARAVHFAGPVADEALDRLYREADVVCLPARYESHGIVMIEAMMHGRPLLTCSTGGIGEVVEPGVNALLSPAEDPRALAGELRAMLGDPELRVRLGAGGREAFEQRFDARLVARRMAGFFEQVIEQHEPAAAAGPQLRERLAELLLDAALASADEADVLAGELLVGRAGVRSETQPGARPAPLELDESSAHTRELLREAALAAQPAPRPQAGGSQEPRVAVVMMTRERPEFLRLALDSLAAQEIACEVLVIDQASSPAVAAAVAAECAWRGEVGLHRSEVNHGIGGGRNLGVDLTRSELVLFLDDDAELMPGALAHMIEVLDADPAAEAVSATVVTPDGLVSHSGGTLECFDGVAYFTLSGCGDPFEQAALAPTGPAGWIGGTALLARRSLLERFPFDEQMRANFDDNEWCYRVTRELPGTLRRSREGLALHHLAGRLAGAPQPVDAARLVAQLVACARFYQLHGVLLGPWSWELLPDRVAVGGDLGLGDVRLLMELIAAKGEAWTLAAWRQGELENLLQANKLREQVERTHPELELFRSEVPRLNQLVDEQRETMSWLFEREATLRRIEAGGWWRLRGRLLSLLGRAQGLAELARRR